MSEKPYFVKKLESGLLVLVFPQDHVNSVSISASVRAGHLSETPKNNGIAHLLEHMLFDGTAKYPTYQKLVDFFDKIAGDFSGTTSYDAISVSGNFVDEELENALSVLDQILFHPQLNKKNLQKEKGIVIDELSSYADSNAYTVYLKTKQIRFKGNTILELPNGGSPKSVKDLTLKQVNRFHKHFFRPDNISLIVAGKCKPEKVFKLLDQYLGAHTNKKQTRHTLFNYDQFSNQEIVILNKPSQKAYVHITFPSFSWKTETERRVALAYLCALLANRRDSLLYKKLREQQGLIYDISADFQVGFDIGIFDLSTSAPIEKSFEVIKEMLSAINYVKKETLSAKKLNILKGIDQKRMKMIFDTTSGIVNWFGNELFYRYPKILLPEDFIQIYDEVSVNDLQSVAQELFDLSKVNVCVLQQCKRRSIEKDLKNKIIKEIKKYE